jgi:pimeloyl-ACP methyl ester carboxylesterase
MLLAYARWPSNPQPTAPRPREKLVFLHGMGGTGALWRPVAASLEERFDILAPDQRGHGRSQIPHTPGSREEPRYTPLDYGQDVVETMKQLDFRPAWIVGHSMGVRSACAAAHLDPDGAKGLVLIDLGFSGPAGGGLGRGLADFLKDFPMRFTSRAEARDYMTARCPDPSIGQYLMAVSVSRPDGAIEFPFDRAALLATLHAAEHASVGAWVRELGSRGMPILVLRGATSGVWSAADFQAERSHFADLQSVEFEEFPGSGHGLPFEKRLEFVARLTRFIETPGATS